MNKHTPGPWEAIGNLVRSPMAKEKGFGVMLAECADRWFLKVNSEEAAANARLMAAAPELLEATKWCVALCEEIGKDAMATNAYAASIAAIAKATGGQS